MGGAGHTFGSSSSQSSVESPDMTYRYPMQAPPPPRGESPTSQHHTLVYPAHSEHYINTPQQTMYNNSNENASTDFSPFPDGDSQSPGGPYEGGPYRNNSMFGSFFPQRQRQSMAGPSSANYGNELNGSGFTPQYAISAAEVFGTHQPLPPLQQQQQPNGARGYDFVNDTQTLKPNGKPIFANIDPFNAGLAAAAASALLQSHQVNKPGQPPPQQQQQLHGFQGQSFMNNMLHAQAQAHSQTPFGPHLAANGGLGGAGMSSHTNGVGTVSVTNQQEEISTIFVVGFPEDMQEREFQNMFTFSSGFEAATLKIPNKDSTAYGANAPSTTGASNSAGRGAFQLGYPYGGANDPYNLVTVNQGGVLVDGRDGTTASWPSADPNDFPPGLTSNVNGQGPVPPRKQIIGFAKFRTRAEALAARDLLQGRRVDIEKGAVLKAEMAKKNLHTKRGVGPLGVPLSVGIGGQSMSSGIGGGMPSAGGLSSITEGLSAMGGMMSPGAGPGAETLSARERELGALGAMGLGHARRERERFELNDEERERERENRRRRELGSVSSISGTGLGTLAMLGPRGARERLEEDERERDRRRKEKEAERNGRLRSDNQAAYDAFHSVTVPLRNPSITSTSTAVGSAVLSPSESIGSYPFPNVQPFSPQDNLRGSGLDAWSVIQGQGGTRKPGSISMNGAMRSLPIGISSSASHDPVYPPSSHESSPSANTDPAFPASLSSRSVMSDNALPQESDIYSPTPNMTLTSHPSMSSLGSRSRPYSPTNEATLSSGFLPHQQQQVGGQGQGQNGSSMPVSSSSSISGSRSSGSSVDGEMSRAIGSIDINPQEGTISPQLPSPNSGASSGSAGARTNASDQNPPINTLYVGNLPTSPTPGNQPNLLEENLRSLFSRCPGYRKLCFRQKSNGPMCFVEFEDVTYATKALNDLYGHQINGLVKGGIRLSYSKNPLGVRTPTGAVSGNTLQQQLQQGLQNYASGSFSSMQDAFSLRQSNGGILSVDMNAVKNARRGDPGEITSPYQFAASPPPPRFFSPPPSTGFGYPPHINTSSIARSSSQGFTSTFSPFGSSTPPNMTPQMGSAETADTLQPHSSLSTTPSLEAARAG